MDPPVEVPPPASPQLPVVTQIQTPTVLLFTIKGACGCGNGFGFAKPTPAGNCPVNPDVNEGVPPNDPLTKLSRANPLNNDLEIEFKFIFLVLFY